MGEIKIIVSGAPQTEGVWYIVWSSPPKIWRSYALLMEWVSFQGQIKETIVAIPHMEFLCPLNIEGKISSVTNGPQGWLY